jgi:hypothetical protein
MLLPESSRSFHLLHVGPCRQFLSKFDEAPYLARFITFLARSSEFSIFSGWVLGLLRAVFASLLDLYRASRSFHEVLNEIIPEVLLSTLKPCINTKLQNRYAQLLTDKRRIPLRSASVRTPHLFHHGIPKVLVNSRSKGDYKRSIYFYALATKTLTIIILENN